MNDESTNNENIETNEETSVSETQNRGNRNNNNRRRGYRKYIGTIGDNIKDLIKGDAKAKKKAALMLKIKFTNIFLHSILHS